MAHTNGKVPRKARRLVQVHPRATLELKTSRAWRDMKRDCLKATGVKLRISVRGGYRSLHAQRVVYRKGTGPVPVAPPGTSTHGLGHAVDINNWAAAEAWLKKHAKDYGFRRQFTSEPWHYLHDASTRAEREER